MYLNYHRCHCTLLNSSRADAHQFYVGQERPKIGCHRECLLEVLVCFILQDSTPDSQGSVTQDLDGFVAELARLKVGGAAAQFDDKQKEQPAVQDSTKQLNTVSKVPTSQVSSSTKSVQKKVTASVGRIASDVSTSQACSPTELAQKKATPIVVEDSSSDSEPDIPLSKTRSKAPVLSKCIISDLCSPAIAYDLHRVHDLNC